MINWNAIAASIGDSTQTFFKITHAVPISGGCINQTWRIENGDGVRYFVKLNDAHKLPMFVAESAGLTAIAATHTVRVPLPITYSTADGQAFLMLEYIALNGSGNARLLGEQLAALHRCTSNRAPEIHRAAAEVQGGYPHPGCSATPHGREPPQFGFSQDNTIGETPQRNIWSSDWIAFWREQRLGFQLDLAAHNGYGGKLQELGHRLMERLPDFFDGYCPLPSLLHGDLWGGNHAYTTGGSPVIFDPAPYYGDREADLAMTELFGGFDPEFYAAYRTVWPLDAGYATRKTLYNLYHILNHANLFGGGYARQAEEMMHRLLTPPI